MRESTLNKVYAYKAGVSEFRSHKVPICFEAWGVGKTREGVELKDVAKACYWLLTPASPIVNAISVVHSKKP